MQKYEQSKIFPKRKEATDGAFNRCLLSHENPVGKLSMVPKKNTHCVNSLGTTKHSPGSQLSAFLSLLRHARRSFIPQVPPSLCCCRVLAKTLPVLLCKELERKHNHLFIFLFQENAAIAQGEQGMWPCSAAS